MGVMGSISSEIAILDLIIVHPLDWQNFDDHRPY